MNTKLIAKFLRDDSGATAIEYGLIAALVSVAAIGALTAMGGSLDAMFRVPLRAISAHPPQHPHGPGALRSRGGTRKAEASNQTNVPRETRRPNRRTQ